MRFWGILSLLIHYMCSILDKCFFKVFRAKKICLDCEFRSY